MDEKRSKSATTLAKTTKPAVKSRSSKSADPLQKVSAHRRSSFREAAMTRVNQRKALELVHQAVCKSLEKREVRQCTSDSTYTKRQITSATKIQAAFRAFSCRRNHLLCDFLNPGKDYSHRRICSEITMSEFGDSILSLSSLDWSPRPDPDPLRNSQHSLDKATFHTSTSTPETFPDSFCGPYQDSFSTIFSQDSFDVPVKPPSRKLSPPARKTIRPDVNEPELALPPFHDPRSMVSSPRRQRNVALPLRPRHALPAPSLRR